MNKRPGYLIIGAMKAGTTSLYNVLIEHSRIVQSEKKELHYFNGNKELDWYIKMLGDCAEDQITGEATPAYIWMEGVPQRVREFCPDVKLIALLRNPVDRAFSHYYGYTQWGKYGFTNLSFRDFIEGNSTIPTKEFDTNGELIPKVSRIYQYVLEQGIYVSQILEWYKWFPKEQLMIIQSEDFFNNQKAVVAEVFNFLDLDLENVSEKHMVRHDYKFEMTEEMRNLLSEFYKPYNSKLYDLLGKDFGWK